MRKFSSVALSFACGVAVTAIWNTPVRSDALKHSDYSFEATYIFEVPRDDFHEFSIGLGKRTGHVGSGYLLGTSNMVSVRSKGECGTNKELEKYLTEYLKGNQFVCLVSRWAK